VTNPSKISRAELLAAAAAGGLGAVFVSLVPMSAEATPEDVKTWLQKTLPGTYQQGKITISAPPIAENGNTVPIGISVDSPMTDQSYVKTIALAADGNPLPGVAVIHLTPANGQANVNFRIRLAQTQSIHAVAEMSDGSLYTASQVIKVTIGGCGG
jgi:sulfur-oxidizing protein SoxY